ncbi:hypothetical protein F7725_014588, partial [Dissostichus mawsoni]
AQSSFHTVRDDADGDQRHGGTLAEGQQVEQSCGVRGRLEGVKQVQQEQSADDAQCFDRRAAALLALGAQTQAEQRAHVTQEAGEGRGVHVNPLWLHTPLLSLLQGPKQVHTHSFKQQVEANSEGNLLDLPFEHQIEPVSDHSHPYELDGHWRPQVEPKREEDKEGVPEVCRPGDPEKQTLGILKVCLQVVGGAHPKT